MYAADDAKAECQDAKSNFGRLESERLRAGEERDKLQVSAGNVNG